MEKYQVLALLTAILRTRTYSTTDECFKQAVEILNRSANLYLQMDLELERKKREGRCGCISNYPKGQCPYCDKTHNLKSANDIYRSIK